MSMHFFLWGGGGGGGGYQSVLWERCKWKMGHSEVSLTTGSVKFQTILWDGCRGVMQFPATLPLAEASLIVQSTTTQYTIQAQYLF